jgi:hypothetical protein
VPAVTSGKRCRGGKKPPYQAIIGYQLKAGQFKVKLRTVFRLKLIYCERSRFALFFNPLTPTLSRRERERKAAIRTHVEYSYFIG